MSIDMAAASNFHHSSYQVFQALASGKAAWLVIAARIFCIFLETDMKRDLPQPYRLPYFENVSNPVTATSRGLADHKSIRVLRSSCEEPR